jgi:hypothetical protein
VILRADYLEAETLFAAAKQAHEYLEERDEALAKRIVFEYAEWRKRSARRGFRRH